MTNERDESFASRGAPLGDETPRLRPHCDRVDEVLDAARSIWRVEREQASRIATGETMRGQTSFDEYLTRRAGDFSYTFRRHLRQIGGAVEE